MTWTQFYDMHSGGSRKEKFDTAYIEAPEAAAVEIFRERYSDPDDVACECCGSNYSIFEFSTLEEATEYERRGRQTLEEFISQDNVLVLRADELP